MDVEVPEYIFALFGAKGKLAELFFHSRNLFAMLELEKLSYPTAVMIESARVPYDNHI